MSDPKIKIKINVWKDAPSDSTVVVLKCQHCKLDHPVSTEYRQKYEKLAKQYKVTIDDVWMCGGCYSAFLGVNARTECTHEVPPFKPEPPSRNHMAKINVIDLC